MACEQTVKSSVKVDVEMIHQHATGYLRLPKAWRDPQNITFTDIFKDSMVQAAS